MTTDLDALVAGVRGLADLLTGLANRATLHRAADALESTAAELRQERERAEDYRLIAASRVDAWRLTDANKELAQAQEVIEKALAITDNANISGHHWMLRDTRNILATYEKGQS